MGLCLVSLTSDAASKQQPAPAAITLGTYMHGVTAPYAVPKTSCLKEKLTKHYSGPFIHGLSICHNRHGVKAVHAPLSNRLNDRSNGPLRGCHTQSIADAATNRRSKLNGTTNLCRCVILDIGIFKSKITGQHRKYS